jgi:hypothetical protein
MLASETECDRLTTTPSGALAGSSSLASYATHGDAVHLSTTWHGVLLRELAGTSPYPRVAHTERRSWRVQSVCGRAVGGSAAYHRRQCQHQAAVARCARPLHKRLPLQAEALHTIPTCIEYRSRPIQPHTHTRTHAPTHSAENNATQSGRCSACRPKTGGWNEHTTAPQRAKQRLNPAAR